MDPPPRALVVGAGSLGTLYGAVLARAGAEVQLLARRAHAEAIQRAGGVEVDGPDGRWTAPVSADWRPQRITPAQIVIVMTKSHDTRDALAGLAHVAGGVETAVSFQNGIEKDHLLADWCGPDRVIGGMSMVGATLDQPGRISHTLRAMTYVGELPAGTSERVVRLAEQLERGGLPVVVADRIRAAEWSKLAHAGPCMTITTLPRLPFDRALQDEALADLYVRLLSEAAAVARAGSEPVELLDLPGTFPVHTYTTLAHDQAAALVRERGREMTAAGHTNITISMLKDLQDGRRLELDAIHRYVVEEGGRRGVPVPLSRACLELLELLDPGGSPVAGGRASTSGRGADH
jgi:2-dehydropantoate 2-reductase